MVFPCLARVGGPLKGCGYEGAVGRVSVARTSWGTPKGLRLRRGQWIVFSVARTLGTPKGLRLRDAEKRGLEVGPLLDGTVPGHTTMRDEVGERIGKSPRQRPGRVSA